MSLKGFFYERGHFSTFKIWRQIAYGVASYIVIINAKGIDWELLLTYMAVVSGSEIAKLVVLQRAGVASTTIATTTVTRNEGEV